MMSTPLFDDLRHKDCKLRHTRLSVLFSLTTALYPSHSPFLGTDPVFATKKSLVSDVKEERDPQKWAQMGFKDGEVAAGRVWVWSYDFVLASVDEVEALKRRS